MMVIELTKGKFTIVDEEDCEWLTDLGSWCWQVSRVKKSLEEYSEGYARRGNCVYMHRLLVDAKPWEIVQHLNGHTLDNRRCNLIVSSVRRLKAKAH